MVTKETDKGKKARKPTTAPAEEPVASGRVELPELRSVQRKTELVMRLLRGEPLDAVSRDSQLPAHELESWKRVFLDTGAQGLKTRAEPEERELTIARPKIGELMMRLELAEHPIEKSGIADEWKRSRRWLLRIPVQKPGRRALHGLLLFPGCRQVLPLPATTTSSHTPLRVRWPCALSIQIARVSASLRRHQDY